MTMVYFWPLLSGLPCLSGENDRGDVADDPGEEDVVVGVGRGSLVEVWLYKDQVN